ncbi:MAG: hypothetical protein OXN79_05485, partial [bacterium]|nr:hypothetical protein [bacterium]
MPAITDPHWCGQALPSGLVEALAQGFEFGFGGLPGGGFGLDAIFGGLPGGGFGLDAIFGGL